MDHLTKDERETMLAWLRETGCICEPNIITDGPVAPGELTNVHVQHDDWCPRLHRAEASLN